MQDPSLQCRWTAEDLERHGRPCWHYCLHLQNQNDVWRSIMTGFPPVAESATPEVPCQLSHPPPPPPPCTNLNVFPIFFSLQFPPIPTVLLLLLLSPPPPPPPPPPQPCCSCFFSLPLHPSPPPPVKVCAYCVYCHDEVVCQCSMLSGDPAGPPHGT